MTTDNIETLIDDNYFGDIFALRSQTLNDFEFGLEATNIDTLLQMFEECEKESEHHNSSNSNTGNSNADETVNAVQSNCTVKVNVRKQNSTSTMNTTPKVTLKGDSESKAKTKGTSLLVKPKSGRRATTDSWHSTRDHDYCRVESKSQLYNKLPQYITGTKSADQSQKETQHFDKIPQYLKGFLSFAHFDAKQQQSNVLSDANIFIDCTDDSLIEVSEVYFDDVLLIPESGSDNNCGNDCERSERMKTSRDECDLPQNSEQMSQKCEEMTPKSRSRSRERYPNNSRRRRISTRSSVDSSSQSSRSSSCSSCSSCSSYSSRNSNDSNITVNSNSIITNRRNNYTRKRSLKESYCNNFERNNSKINCFMQNEKRKSNNCITRQSMEMKKDICERKVLYVGKIPDGTTKTDVRHWFGCFGAIKEVSVHFRDYGDNYAFVTFYRKCDAFEALEHANDDPKRPKFDICFGGRRQFCKTRYEDLDYVENDSAFSAEGLDFDSLLRSTQAKLNR